MYAHVNVTCQNMSRPISDRIPAAEVEISNIYKYFSSLLYYLYCSYIIITIRSYAIEI